jgi:Na+/H+ antiporter NhaD/arsenite permease-like protein
MLRISQVIESGRFVELKFVLATFLFSMFVTNDVALVMLIPLTLLVHVEKKGMLVILEALAANAGSALTPFGNPQNLFIYWIYGIHPAAFIICIAPFSIFFLILILLVSLALKRSILVKNVRVKPIEVGPKVYSYLLLLAVLILVILHLLPVFMVATVLVYALFFDRQSLKIDYTLLLTFVCFFGLADNLKGIFTTEISSTSDIFLYTAGISQIISNVPATLLLSKYTSQWEALLWGSSVGGFGSLVASLANLIAYKQYVSHEASKNKKASFTLLFLLIGFIALLTGIGLYFLIKNYV